MITITPDEKKERERNSAAFAGATAAERGEPCTPHAFITGRYNGDFDFPEEASAAYAQTYERIMQEIARLTPITVLTRSLRDCPWNTEITEGKKKGQLLYDWRIEIAGEHVGFFSSVGGTTLNGDRFQLIDREKQRVQMSYPNSDQYSRHTVGARKKAEFLGVLAHYLDNIPTAADIAERHAATARRKAQAIVDEKARATEVTLHKYAAEMYEALQKDSPPVSFELVIKINSEIAAWHVAIDRGDDR